MREEEIKLACNRGNFEKDGKDVDAENILAPGLIKIREPSEKTTVRIVRRRSKAEAYFAAMEDMREE
jgi:hypothetical protein